MTKCRYFNPKYDLFQNFTKYSSHLNQANFILKVLLDVTCYVLSPWSPSLPKVKSNLCPKWLSLYPSKNWTQICPGPRGYPDITKPTKLFSLAGPQCHNVWLHFQNKGTKTTWSSLGKHRITSFLKQLCWTLSLQFVSRLSTVVWDSSHNAQRPQLWAWCAVSLRV